MKGKMGQNLREHAEDALLSRKIATIRTDAPLEIDLTKVHFPDFDPTAVVEAFFCTWLYRYDPAPCASFG